MAHFRVSRGWISGPTAHPIPALGNAQGHAPSRYSRAESPAYVGAGPMSAAPWGGLAALNPIGVIVTHGVAMGWYGAGPLALKSAMLFSGIAGQFPVNSKPRSGSLLCGLLSVLVTRCFKSLPFRNSFTEDRTEDCADYLSPHAHLQDFAGVEDHFLWQSDHQPAAG